MNSPIVNRLKTAPTRLPTAPSRSPACSCRYSVTCRVASPDSAALEVDTTVVPNCSWVKAFSLSIQTGNCPAAPSTWSASTAPIPTPRTTNSNTMPTSSRPVALPLRQPRRWCSHITAGSSANASSCARTR